MRKTVQPQVLNLEQAYQLRPSHAVAGNIRECLMSRQGPRLPAKTRHKHRDFNLRRAQETEETKEETEQKLRGQTLNSRARSRRIGTEVPWQQTLIGASRVKANFGKKTKMCRYAGGGSFSGLRAPLECAKM